MKRIAIILLSAVVLFTLTACNGKSSTSSGSKDTTSKLTEKDIFEYNGTESEYNITESEVKELFDNQPSTSSDNSVSQDQSSKPQSNTESQDNASNESKASSTQSDITDSSSSTTTSTNKFDKDGDGWTDGWK